MEVRKEEWGNRRAEHKLGLEAHLLSEVLAGWGAYGGKQFSKVVASTEPAARMSEYESQLHSLAE